MDEYKPQLRDIVRITHKSFDAFGLLGIVEERTTYQGKDAHRIKLLNGQTDEFGYEIRGTRIVFKWEIEPVKATEFMDYEIF